MKLKQLTTIQECPIKATLRYETDANSFNTSGRLNQLIKELFTKDITSLDELDNIDDKYLDEKFPDLLFASSKEKKSFLKKVAYYVESFSANFKNLQDRTLTQKVDGSVEYCGKTIDVSVDMILESDTEVDLVNIKLTTAKIKAGGRKEETKIECSLELFFMYLLGEKLYPNKSVRATLAYIKEDKYSKNYLASRIRTTSKDDKYFTDKINELYSKNKYAENCSSSNCSMCSYKTLCTYTHNFEPLPIQEVAVELEEPAQLPIINYTLEQEDVIDFNSGIAIVNAVAGSGKTATIVKRLARFIKEENIPYDDILILSFSEKTIDEFKEKLANHHGIIDFENIFTFHGFGDKILAENYDSFGYKVQPRLINQIEKMDIIKEVLDSSMDLSEVDDIKSVWNTALCILKSVDYSKPFMKNGKNLGVGFHLDKIFTKIKSKGLRFSRDEFITEEVLPFEQAADKATTLTEAEKDYVIEKYESLLNKIYSMYESFDFLLKSKGLYDYADQVKCLVYALNHPRLKDLFNYKHIVCDEFQDSNNIDMYILKRLTLSREFKSLLVVGDINQSIYGFLGTTPENLLTFEKRFANKTHKFDLSYSFRVPKVVAHTANALMNSSYQIKYNQMNAFKADKGVLSTFHDIDSLLDTIKNAVAQNKTVGIITTKNSDLNIFINMLVENNIEYVVKSNLDVMKKDKVLSLLSLSKFFKYPDSHALEYAKYLQVADNEEFSKHFKTDTFNDYFKSKLDEILDTIDLKNPRELLDIYFGLLSELAEKDYMIETFVNHLKAQRFKSIYEANDYCEKMELYGLEVKAKDNGVNCNVVLTTAHSSKGREFDIVIMDTSTFKAKGEEDRRLFYVAMTRAKESLYFVTLDRKGESKKDCRAFLEPISKSLAYF